MTVTTSENTVATTAPKALQGWGYFYPPSIKSSFTTPASGFTPNTCATAGAIDVVSTAYSVCLPVGFDKLTTKSDLAGVSGTSASHVIGARVAMWAVGTDARIAGCDEDISGITVDFDTTAASTGFTVSNPSVGDIGDAVAVYIHNTSNKTYKPYAIRAASVVTKAAAIDFNGSNTIVTPGAAAW